MRDQQKEEGKGFSFQKVLLIFFSIIFGAILLLGISSYKYSLAMNESGVLIRHTQIVIDVADQILSTVKDIQLESNGYIITRDSSFLRGYSNAKKSLYLKIDNLSNLTGDNPLQQRQIDTLILAANDLIRSAQQFITANENVVGEKQNILERISVSRISRERMKTLINGIKNEENRLLSLREQMNIRNTSNFRTAFFSMLVLIFLLMNLIFFLTRYHIDKQKKAEQKIRESEEQIKLLVNNVKDYAIFMIDPRGNILTWNKGAENIKGYTAEEIIGKHISVFCTNEEIESGEIEHNLQKARTSGVYRGERWRVRKDGTRFWADIIITPVYDDRGILQGYTKVTRDNTLRKHTEESLKNALMKEKELNELKSNFISTASHEFRTPLSTILSSVFLLEKYTTTEQQHQREKHIDRIKNSVKNLLIILDDFLSLEKIEEGKVEQKNKIFNLKELSSKLCEEMKDFAKAGQLICYSYEGKEKVILDAVLIKHIMNNLISNAIKYSHDDGRIDICISVNESHITITIRDSGIGISREDQKHLFERFFRASNTAGIQGTGLGLHIVKHYVDMLNGTIRLDSEIGKGSEFVVELSEKTD